MGGKSRIAGGVVTMQAQTPFCAFCVADDTAADVQVDTELGVLLCRRCREGGVGVQRVEKALLD